MLIIVTKGSILIVVAILDSPLEWKQFLHPIVEKWLVTCKFLLMQLEKKLSCLG